MDIKHIIYLAGGVRTTAKALGLSRNAVNKWTLRGRLPATEFTGETQYAPVIAELVNSKGVPGVRLTPLDICPGSGQYMVQAEPADTPQ